MGANCEGAARLAASEMLLLLSWAPKDNLGFAAAAVATDATSTSSGAADAATADNNEKSGR